MRKAIIRFFGLKGSWKWAVRQLKRGRIVRPGTATGSVKYRLDYEAQGRILWTHVETPVTRREWSNAYIFVSDFDATDWVVWNSPRGKR